MCVEEVLALGSFNVLNQNSMFDRKNEVTTRL